MIRKPDPPDSNTHISISEPGPGVSGRAPSSGDLPAPIPEATQPQESVSVTGPDPSTSGVTRPGPSNHVIHQHSKDTNKYVPGERFDYFVGACNNSESVEDENDDNVVTNDVGENGTLHVEEGLNMSEDDDDIDLSSSDDDDVDKDRKKRNKWEGRQELKWEQDEDEEEVAVGVGVEEVEEVQKFDPDDVFFYFECF